MNSVYLFDFFKKTLSKITFVCVPNKPYCSLLFSYPLYVSKALNESISEWKTK